MSIPKIPSQILIIAMLLWFAVSLLFGQDPIYLYMLTVAQIIYVPIVLSMITDERGNTFFNQNKGIWWTAGAVLSVGLLHLIPNGAWTLLPASFYLIFTGIIAAYGMDRFFRRGFVHLEEFCIDIAFIYLAIGGVWFFAHIANINTGFSPIITWLTAIHFHYAAFLFPIFTGFLGRIHKTKNYIRAASAVLLAPILLALGITFSVWLELVSVLLYIFSIYSLLIHAWKTVFPTVWQKSLIMISYGSLCITIIFSLLYALGNAWEMYDVSISFMLHFHGLFNSICFALIGIVGWMLQIPPSSVTAKNFPISQVRGRKIIGELSEIQVEKPDKHKGSKPIGLVDDMSIYEPDLDIHTLSPSITDFYQHTLNYQLEAEIRWRSWFKPFATLYRLLSKHMQQLNLPLHGKRIEMNGGIVQVDDKLDGRTHPRAWIRKIGDEVVFFALYSWHRAKHRTNECSLNNCGNKHLYSDQPQVKTTTKTYMNISLPLPRSSMIGILELKQIGCALQLSSIKSHVKSDAGIYLAWHKYVTALPINESFSVEEVSEGKLRAQHRMWIFSLPFLEIYYDISHK